MKTNLLKAVALAIVMTSFFNCSVEPTDELENTVPTEALIIQQTLVDPVSCSGQNPRARLTNNGTIPFDFKILDLNGIVIESEDNVMPGVTSDWKTFPDGQFIFAISNVNFFGEKVSYAMDFCTELNLEINVNNQFAEAQPQEASN